MARKPRFFVPGQYYHVIQRGNNKSKIFYNNDDYKCFINIIRKGLDKYPCKIYSYCLMDNHFHLLMSPGNNDSISEFMKFIGIKYVQYLNRRLNRSGTLWDGRFKSYFIENERYFLTCICYIEMNPVKAKLVKRPESFKWSSYSVRAYGSDNDIVTYDPWYEGLAHDPKERQLVYRKLISSLALGSDPTQS